MMLSGEDRALCPASLQTPQSLSLFALGSPKSVACLELAEVLVVVVVMVAVAVGDKVVEECELG